MHDQDACTSCTCALVTLLFLCILISIHSILMMLIIIRRNDIWVFYIHLFSSSWSYISLVLFLSHAFTLLFTCALLTCSRQSKFICLKYKQPLIRLLGCILDVIELFIFNGVSFVTNNKNKYILRDCIFHQINLCRYKMCTHFLKYMLEHWCRTWLAWEEQVKKCKDNFSTFKV